MQYYLVLDRKTPKFDLSFESSAFAEAGEYISSVSEALSIKNLFELFSYTPQNSLCPPGYEETEIPWFEAQEGIDWLAAVLGHLRSNTEKAKRPDRLITDLQDCQHILTKAKEIGATWHFEMDM